MTGPVLTWLLLAGAVVLLPPGRTASATSARPGRGAALPRTLDLVAAALSSGQPVAAALACAAPEGDPAVAAALIRVSGLLRLGADPDEAWAAIAGDATLAPVVAVARRSADSGVRLAAALTRLSGELREQRAAAALTRAQRAGALAMLPLGLCFLPAFVCLGVVPVIAGIAASVLPSLT